MNDLDDTIVDCARRIADAIGQTLGPSCEIAVHDLRNPTHSLVHLVNGHVSGRQIGAPIRDLIYRVLPEMDSKQAGLFNYLTVLDDGRRLKSSTCILRSTEDAPLVAFCLNLDVTHLEAAARTLGELTTLDERSSQPLEAEIDEPTEYDDVTGILRQLVVNIVRPAGRAPESLSKRDRLAIIEFLDKKGAFRIKGAIRLVARELGTSEPTIYRHIEEVRRRSTVSPGP
jgi:predicted transcriptional regulator YheO